MTENEAIRNFQQELREPLSPFSITMCNMAIKALEEIQQYRAIGTVKQIMEMQFATEQEHDEVLKYRAIGTVEDIEKSLQNVSVLLAEHELLKLYQSIGTIDEFKALKEKNTPMELAEHNFQDEPHHYLCPMCKNIVDYMQNYCEECGQALEG